MSAKGLWCGCVRLKHRVVSGIMQLSPISEMWELARGLGVSTVVDDNVNVNVISRVLLI